MRDAISEIANGAPPGARVASESQTLASYYAQRAGRPDLGLRLPFGSNELQELREGDFVIVARGASLFSNELILAALEQSRLRRFVFSTGQRTFGPIYQLDRSSLTRSAKPRRQFAPNGERLERRTTALRKILGNN